MLRKVFTAVSLSLLLGILCGGICFGQIKSGTITGRVTDSSGAVIPAAQVTVVNEGTRVSQVTRTSGTGDYTVPFLEPGTYDVTIMKEGFATFTATGINIGTDTTRQVDAQISVGRTATVVEVKGEGAAALQTETATVGDTVNTQAIQELPDMNHNPFFYATLQPGVAGRWQLMDNSSALSFGIGPYSNDEWSAFSINGAGTFTASISVDGVNIQGANWNEATISPAPEAIQEVKTYTNDYDASIGRGQGAVAVVTKGGTNSFHGVVFGRLRNEALNANSFLNDVEGDSQAAYGHSPIPKAPFKVAYYGAAVGGPIKKDKAFFFASWQGMAHNSTLQELLNVPMNTQAKGDFASPEGCPAPSAAAAASGATATSNTMGTCVNVSGVATPVQFFNPFSATLLSSGVYQHAPIVGPAGPSDMSQVGDPGAIGPNGYWSYYPQANRFPIDQYNDQNYYWSGLETFRSQTVNSRVDVNHGKNNLYFTGGIQVGTIDTPGPWGKGTPQFYYPPVQIQGGSSVTAKVYNHVPYGAIGDTFIVSPTLVVDARFGVTRIHLINSNPLVSGVNYSNFGMPATVQAILPQPGAAPDFGTSAVGQWTPLNDTPNGHKNGHETHTDLAVSATKIKGNWTLKWGGEYLDDFNNSPNKYYTGGYAATYGCGGCEYTNASYASVAQNSTPAIAGLNVADLTMGAAYYGIVASETITPTMESQYLALFSQNTWKVTSRLTLNLGLRWDVQPGTTDRHNQIMTLNNNATTNPICTNASIDPTGFGCQGAFYFVGLNGNSRHSWATEYNNFAPRLGLAYRLNGTTVIRGGYGISYLPTNTGYTYGPGYFNPSPWGLGDTDKPFGNTTPAGVPLYTWSNPLVSPIITPVGSNPGAPQAYGGSQSGMFPSNYQNAYMQQYNFMVEKKVGNWLFTVGYSGSKGSRLPFEFATDGENTTLYNAAQPVIQCYHAGLNCPANDSSVAGAGYLQTGADPFTQPVTNPFNPTGTLPYQGLYSGSTIQRGIYDGPFPLFAAYSGVDFTGEWLSRGYSFYNSLQLEAKHQISHGLMLDVFYTWSKALDASMPIAEANQAIDTGQSSVVWNQVDLRSDRRYSTDDIPGRFVANLVYQLPFGAGHSLNPGNKLARYLASGWSIGATEMDESGYPLSIYDDDAGALNGRPNRALNEPLLLPKVDQKWYNGTTSVTLPDGRIITPCNYCFLKYNPDAFTGAYISSPTTAGKYLNDTYWLGNSALNYSTVRDPSINNLNFTLRRSFKVTERVAIEFQANATNLLNHPNIETYTSDPGSMNLSASNTTNTSLGQGTNSSNYGTHSLTDFDSRQIEFQMNVRF
jgi:hypothetical protein